MAQKIKINNSDEAGENADEVRGKKAKAAPKSGAKTVKAKPVKKAKSVKPAIDEEKVAVHIGVSPTETVINEIKKEEQARGIIEPAKTETGGIPYQIKSAIERKETKAKTADPAAIKIKTVSAPAPKIAAAKITSPVLLSKKAEEDDDEASSSSRPVGFYRRIAFIFMGLAGLTILVIGYFTFVRVDISIVPNQERVSNNLIFDVSDEAGGENAVKGIVKTAPFTITENYNATGKEVIGQETVGKVKIINNYTKSQMLVATTRLLAADGKLFRLKETVNVPAGGTVEADVYGDKSGPEMAIAPTTFTIPGLWAGLQDKIYAQSETAFIFEEKAKKRVLPEDIDNGLLDIKQKLAVQAKEDIGRLYSEYDQLIHEVKEDTITYEIGAKSGEERDTFPISVTADVAVVGFKGEDAVRLAREKFLASVSSNREVIEFDEKNITYSLQEYKADLNQATINAAFEGKVSLKDYQGVINVDKILGLSQKQLEAYLSGIPEIAGYEIKFFPSFIKKVPSLADRVHIELKK
jgi:hypothetical protein